jgi:hypothetical protein
LISIVAKVQLKSSIPIGAKVEIGSPPPQGLNTRAEIEKVYFQSAPS